MHIYIYIYICFYKHKCTSYLRNEPCSAPPYMYVYINIYIYTLHIYVYIHIYIYIPSLKNHPQNWSILGVVLQGGSSPSRFLIREHSKYFDQSTCHICHMNNSYLTPPWMIHIWLLWFIYVTCITWIIHIWLHFPRPLLLFHTPRHAYRTRLIHTWHNSCVPSPPPPPNPPLYR